jgi:hypothetical protein
MEGLRQLNVKLELLEYQTIRQIDIRLRKLISFIRKGCRGRQLADLADC